MTIKQISEEANKIAHKKGFWEEGFNISEKLMLVVSEIAEAQEADRKGIVQMDLEKFEKAFENESEFLDQDSKERVFYSMFEDSIKNSFGDELADAAIRIFDLAFEMGIDLETHIAFKMRYNSLRPYKHGKRY